MGGRVQTVVAALHRTRMAIDDELSREPKKSGFPYGTVLTGDIIHELEEAAREMVSDGSRVL
jgi:hypothetical protein